MNFWILKYLCPTQRIIDSHKTWNFCRVSSWINLICTQQKWPHMTVHILFVSRKSGSRTLYCPTLLKWSLCVLLSQNKAIPCWIFKKGVKWTILFEWKKLGLCVASTLNIPRFQSQSATSKINEKKETIVAQWN